MPEFLEYDFMLKALLAGLLIGLTGSFYGVFVVQRKMAFLGTGLGHAAFGGVALGLLIGVQPILSAMIFTLIASLVLTWIRLKTGISSDSGIGIMFAVSVAIGIILLSLNENNFTDAYSYIFGSILAISKSDLIISIIVTLLSLVALLKFWPIWSYSAFDKEMAQTDGAAKDFYEYIFAFLLALTVVISLKILGIILISAFLVIPAASARLFSGTFFLMTIASILIGVFSAIFGLIISFYADFPSGASIVLFLGFVFLISSLISKFKKN